MKEKIKKAYIEFKGLKIEIEVIGHKSSYGNERFLIKPVSGEGESWVENIIEIK